MLDIDTLNALHDLMAKTLYTAEVARLPKLSRAEETELVTRARGGDAAARAALVVSSLHHALGKAHYYYNTRRPLHDDEMDLAQEASLAMLRRLDYALTKRSPVPYLRAIAAKSISIYLTYFSRMIPLPTQATRETMATFDIPVERLDVPAYRTGTRLKMDIIEVAPLPDEEAFEDAEQRERRFAPLYDAMQRLLTPRERNGVVRRYRLGDDLLDPSAETPIRVDREAIQKLRKALGGHLTQMLSPEQQE